METVVLLDWDAFRWCNCWNWCSALLVQACSGSLALSPAGWEHFAIGADIAPKGLPDWCLLLSNSCLQQHFCTASWPTAQQICCRGQGRLWGKVCCQLPWVLNRHFSVVERLYHQLKGSATQYRHACYPYHTEEQQLQLPEWFQWEVKEVCGSCCYDFLLRKHPMIFILYIDAATPESCLLTRGKWRWSLSSAPRGASLSLKPFVGSLSGKGSERESHVFSNQADDLPKSLCWPK